MNRQEIRGLTIDSEYSRDLDDAFWIEETKGQYRVDVSITDASEAISHGSPADLRARAQAETIYRPGFNVPMLPRGLAEGKLSLFPNKKRDCITVRVFLNLDGSTISTEIFHSVMASEAKLSHKRVDEELLNPTGRFHDQLELCQRVATQLYENRRSAGATALYDVTSHLYADEEGVIRKYEGDFFHAQMIVQEMMILANAEVAKWLVMKGERALFRNHKIRAAAPKRDAILEQVNNALVHVDQLPGLREKMGLWFEKATYGTTVEGHFGLNLPAYLHFTSPIRRYADLVNHRIVKAVLKGEKAQVEDLDTIATELTELRRKRDEAQSEHFKERMKEKRREQAVNTKGLNAAQFSKVAKRAIKDGNTAIQPDLIERIKGGDITPFDLYAVLFTADEAWVDAKAAALDLIDRKTYYAIMVLELLTQQDGATYDFVTEGSFTSWVKVSYNGQETANREGATDTSKKGSQAKAAFRWILGWQSGDVIPFDQVVRTPAKVEAADANYVGLVNEWCQVNKAPPPTFEFISKGESHAPTFECKATLMELTAIAASKTKQDAKRAACAQLYRQIKK